jgi:hypothetical protein
LNLSIKKGFLMAETYQRQAALAARLIKAKGEPVTFYKTGATVTDPFGNETTEPTVTATGDGLLLRYKANDIDGTVIQTQDAYVLYYGERPANNMNIDHGGRTWAVVTSEPLQPTEAVILYKVQVR